MRGNSRHDLPSFKLSFIFVSKVTQKKNKMLATLLFIVTLLPTLCLAITKLPLEFANKYGIFADSTASCTSGDYFRIMQVFQPYGISRYNTMKDLTFVST